MNLPLKYPSTKHWPWSQTVHRDDSYHQSPEFFVGKEVVITEKLDGGNTCLYDGEVYARSVQAPSHDGWMAMVRKHHAWKSITNIGCSNHIILYGEDLFGIHSIEYNPIKEDETFRLFAVRTLDKSKKKYDIFRRWDDVMMQSRVRNLPLIPVVFRGFFSCVEHITEFFENEIKNGSQLGGECEGFVMRVTNEFEAEDFALNVCKYVRANHVQTDQHWRKNWKQCQLKK